MKPQSLSADRKQRIEKLRGFPENWGDDYSMKFMFANLPKRKELDVAQWNQKFKFWETAIVDTQRALIEEEMRNRRSSSKNCLAFSLETLHTRFTRKSMKPRPISQVIAHLIKSKKVCRAKSLSSSSSSSSSSSYSGYVYSSVSLLADQLYKLALGGGDQKPQIPDEDEVLIIPSLIDEVAHIVHTRMIQNAEARADYLIPRERIAKEFVCFSNSDLNLLFNRMQSLGLAREINPVAAAVSSVSRGKWLKLAPSAASSSSELQVCESDGYIAMFKEAIVDIEKNIASGEENVTKLKVGILNKKSKAAALFLLRKRKRTQKRVDQARNHLENLEMLYESLQSTWTNTQVMKVLRKGGKELKRVTETDGLDPDSIRDDLDDLRDLCTTVDEMFEAAPADEEEESQLQAELEAMMKEDAMQNVDNSQKNHDIAADAKVKKTVQNGADVLQGSRDGAHRHDNVEQKGASKHTHHNSSAKKAIETKKKKAVLTMS